MIKHNWRTAHSFPLQNLHVTTQTKRLHVIFPAFIILECLTNTKENKKSTEIATWLLNQGSPSTSSFNFWQINAPERKTRPLPDDLDDTFCAWSAIYRTDPSLLTPKVLAQLTKLLINREEAEGGPYRTWLTDNPDPIWQDCDPIVNCNIANFLTTQHIYLDKQLSFISSRLKEHFNSPYYESFFPCAYFFSRLYSHLPEEKQHILQPTAMNAKELLLTHWKEQQSMTPHYAAIMTTSLMRLGYRGIECKQAQDFIQEQNDWSFGDLCTDQKIHGIQYYAGSPAATAALCLEACSFCISPYPASTKKSLTGREPIEQVFLLFNNFCKSLPLPLSKNIATLGKNLLNENNATFAILLPFLFHACLSPQEKKRISLELLQQLGYANLCGWISMTIFDHAMDREPLAFNNIPEALTCYQKTLEIYHRTYSSKKEWMSFFQNHLHEQTLFYSQELDSTSIFEPKDAAKKSLPIALAVFIQLFLLDEKPSGSRFKYIHNFFLYFFAAKQLSDDIVDWKEDLEMHRNTPVTQLLNEHTKTKQRFPKKVSNHLCNLVKDYLQTAEENLEKAHLYSSKPFYDLLVQMKKELKKKEIEIEELQIFAKELSL